MSSSEEQLLLTGLFGDWVHVFSTRALQAVGSEAFHSLSFGWCCLLVTHGSKMTLFSWESDHAFVAVLDAEALLVSDLVLIQVGISPLLLKGSTVLWLLWVLLHTRSLEHLSLGASNI